jgi:hypothetical protein
VVFIRETGIVDLQITLRCNVKCPNCIKFCNMKDSTGLNYSDSDMTMGQIDNFIQQIRDFKHKSMYQNICITGGEPLLHPNIEEITLKLEILRQDGHFKDLTINSNLTLDIPPILRKYIINHSEPKNNNEVHNTALLHPLDFGGKQYTFDSCTHYRKGTIVANYMGFSVCCAGDGFIRLFGYDDLILDHLPPTMEGFPLKEMDKVCMHCPFSNQGNDGDILPTEKEEGCPVSRVYAKEANKNKLGRKITKRLPIIQ